MQDLIQREVLTVVTEDGKESLGDLGAKYVDSPVLNYLFEKLGLKKLNFQETGMREVKAAKKKSESICGIWHLDLESKLDLPGPDHVSLMTGVVIGLALMRLITVVMSYVENLRGRGRLPGRPVGEREVEVQADFNIAGPAMGVLNFPEVVYYTEGGHSIHSSRRCRALRHTQRQLKEKHKCGHCTNDFNFQDPDR